MSCYVILENSLSITCYSVYHSPYQFLVNVIPAIKRQVVSPLKFELQTEVKVKASG